jgi:hypothetical protein
MLKTLFEIVLFEDAGNQWSLSRPILSLIMTSEQVPAFFVTNTTFLHLCCWAHSCIYCLHSLFWLVFLQMFGDLRAHILASQVRVILCLQFYYIFFYCWKFLPCHPCEDSLKRKRKMKKWTDKVLIEWSTHSHSIRIICLWYWGFYYFSFTVVLCIYYPFCG